MQSSSLLVSGNVSNQGPSILAFEVVFEIVVVITTILRLLGRSFLARQLSWDDLLIAISTTLTVVSFGFNIKQIQDGYGHHQEDLTVNQIIQINKWGELSTFVLLFVSAFTKISICLFAKRIPSSHRLKSFLWSLIAFVTVVNTACAIVFVITCRPLNKLWNPAVPGTCIDFNAFLYMLYVQAAASVLVDLACTALPILVLWKVQISLENKIAICGLMAVGLVASACSFFRCVMQIRLTNPADIAWTSIGPGEWSLSEQYVSIIAANLPLLLPVYRLTWNKLVVVYQSIQSRASQWRFSRRVAKQLAEDQRQRGSANLAIGNPYQSEPVGKYTFQESEHHLEMYGKTSLNSRQDSAVSGGGGQQDLSANTEAPESLDIETPSSLQENSSTIEWV
ncbi:hypothetical protein MMC25_003826 [Agyrium rufum]|nr:hypothetical protein [Agyrium rufum]